LAVPSRSLAEASSWSTVAAGLFHGCSSLDPMKLYSIPGMAMTTPLRPKKCCHDSIVFCGETQTHNKSHCYVKSSRGNEERTVFPRSSRSLGTEDTGWTRATADSPCAVRRAAERAPLDGGEWEDVGVVPEESV